MRVFRSHAALPNLLPEFMVTVLGCGAVLGIAAALTVDVPLAIAGGTLFGLGLVVILAAGWLDPLRLMILCLPLPALYSSDTARIAPPLLLSGVIVLAWLLARAADTRPIAWRQLPVRSLLFLLFAVLAAAALAQSPVAAAREVINWMVLLAFLLIAASELAHAPKRVHGLALTIAAVASVCGVLAALEMVGVIPARFTRTTSTLNRAALGFGWPNELGMFLALCLPFGVYACRVVATDNLRWLARAGLAATIVGLVATFSRGSWLSVLSASLVLLLAGERRLVLRIWVSALLAGLLLDLATGGAIRDRIASTIGDWVVEQRFALMLAGVLMFVAHPFTGVGPGGYADSLELFGPGITWLWDYLPTAQNAYVQMAAETGALGLLALLLFLFSGLRTVLRSARERRTVVAGAPEPALHATLLWAFATACALGMVEWTFAHGVGQMIMLIAAMGFALGRTRTSPRGGWLSSNVETQVHDS